MSGEVHVGAAVVGAGVGLALGPWLAAGAERVVARRDVEPAPRARLVVALLAGATLGVLGGHLGAGWELVAYGIVGFGLVVLTWIDLRVQWLPREVTAVTVVASAPFFVLAALVDGEPRRLLDALLGALLATATLLVVHVVGRGGLGDGDVRLAPLLGMALGWLNVALVPVGLLFGFFAGALAGVVLLVTRRANRRSPVAFGPFLALGTLAAVVVGGPFLDAVLHR